MCGLLGSAAPKVDFIVILRLNPVHLKARYVLDPDDFTSLASLLPASTLHPYLQPHPEPVPGKLKSYYC